MDLFGNANRSALDPLGSQEFGTASTSGNVSESTSTTPSLMKEKRDFTPKFELTRSSDCSTISRVVIRHCVDMSHSHYHGSLQSLLQFRILDHGAVQKRSY